MTLLWIVVVVLALVATGFAAWPIWKQKVLKAMVERDQLNVVIFEDRLAELDAELAEGVLTQERYEQARNELRRDLLINTGSDGGDAGAAAPGGRWMAPLLGLLVPAIALFVYLQVGAPELAGKPPTTAQGDPHQRIAGDSRQAGDMDTMIRRLQERLEKNPNDIDGWVLLGRSLSMEQRFSAAAEAYGKAYELAGDVPEIMAQYAETLALSNKGQFEGKPIELLNRAREVGPPSPRILWLLGVVAAQQGDPAEAVRIWNQLLAMLPAGSNAAEMVETSIRRVGGKPVVANNSTTPKSGSGERPVTGAGTVKLNVTLSPELKERVAPGDTVFIFARAEQGPRMPIAAVRHQVRELPLTITLDDSSGMAGRKLSAYDRVVVVARVSKAASPMPQSGDLEGKVVARTGNQEVVPLLIDHVRP